jgi:hypothetical protein
VNQELLIHERSEVMRPVTLYTASGETVTDVYLPDVSPRPQVILWGVWCFVWYDMSTPLHPRHGQYREASIVYLPVERPLPV